MLEKINISTGHFAVILYIVFGLTLLFNSKGKKALIFMAIPMFIIAARYLKQVLSIYDVFDSMNYIFSPPILLWGLLISASLCLYPYEDYNPEGLNIKRFFVFVLPVVIMITIYFIAEKSGMHWRRFDRWTDILLYKYEFNVWLRFLLFFGILIYSSINLYIFYLGIKHGKYPKKAFVYGLVFILNVMTYAIVVFYGALQFVLIHKISFMFFNLAITYHSISFQMKRQVINYPDSSTSASGERLSLQERLLAMMDEEKPWLDPEITQPKLAGMLYTNRTTLSGVIHNLGYSNFQEFINYYRIQEFKRIILQERVTHIQETFYRVGFRSKSTAFRSFLQFENITPSNYLRQQYKYIDTWDNSPFSTRDQN